jgi:hypothetical protein
MLHRLFWYKLTDVSEVLTASIIKTIALMMEAVSTSETSVSFYQTTRHILEDIHLQTRRRENLKSHQILVSNRCASVLFIYFYNLPRCQNSGFFSGEKVKFFILLSYIFVAKQPGSLQSGTCLSKLLGA